jgi:peptidoglycan/LPS O-acetylase OafA/YrhL
MNSSPELGSGIASSTRSLTVPNWSVRIPALDGLRGIAILLVLLKHSLFGMPTTSKFWAGFANALQLTWSGVDLFFVLSGFLIGGILLDARESPRYFKTFYIRRAYRIFPLYGVVTALFLTRHLPFHLLPGRFGDVSPLMIPWWSYVTLTQNIWMAQRGGYGAVAMAVTWSLAVEEQFYLTIPLLVRLIRLKGLLYLLLVVVVGVPFLRLAVRHIGPYGDFACYILMPCRADALCIGVLSAMLVRSEPGWKWLLEKRKILYFLTSVLFVGIVFMTYRGYPQFSLPMTTVGYSWLAIFYAGCLLLGVSSSSRSTVLHNRTLGGLGTFAYCTYLLHFPLIQAARRLLELHLPKDRAWLPGGMLGIAVTLLIAILSWKYFEKPLLRRGHRYVY